MQVKLQIDDEFGPLGNTSFTKICEAQEICYCDLYSRKVLLKISVVPRKHSYTLYNFVKVTVKILEPQGNDL